MLNKFRKIYPKGSIVSQLIKIDRDKYIVRASIEVEGKTLATGLASAQTIEEAEDRARVRALAAALASHPSNSSQTVIQSTTIESTNVAQSIAQPSALSGQSISPSSESDEMSQINRAPTTPQINNPSSEIIKRWYDQRDNEQDLKAVDSDRHLNPVDNDRHLNRVESAPALGQRDRTLNPVDNERLSEASIAFPLSRSPFHCPVPLRGSLPRSQNTRNLHLEKIRQNYGGSNTGYQ
ncbi:MAG: hypothetical protein QNJ54_35125 [Prochloraceae cyanobacterium]|nr:hypothetical protein [Prochloraceae cyanobacterium]